MSKGNEVFWVDVPAPFGEAWENGCCTAFVRGTVCGFPRKPDGSCTDGHPPQLPDARTYSRGDLRAAGRVSA